MHNIYVTAISTEVYNALLVNHIKHEIEKILGKKKKKSVVFREVDP